jgi:hypothetical protein
VLRDLRRRDGHTIGRRHVRTHRSRGSVHQPVVHWTAESARHSDQYGRDRVLARQWGCRAAVKNIKYEEVYLYAYETVNAAQRGLACYLTFYNQIRPHRALDGKTPEEVNCDHLPPRRTAA